MPEKKWARAKQSGAHGLRRGAWYMVVNDPGGSLVVLNVRKDNVPVPRSMVVISDEPPDRWSVVRWEETQQGAQRASEQSLGMLYAVCPKCGERQKIDPPDAGEMTCEACGGTFPMNWETTC
ncbi:MAG: TFIIB-type zinc ribbon-containing protein [Gemmatimonadales bacterium]